MSLYCLLAAPLFIGTDLRKMTNETYSLYTNTRVLAINQDTLGIQGQRILQDEESGQVWSKPLADGSYAVVFVNGNATVQVDLEMNWDSLANAWNGFVFEYGGSYSTSDAIRPYWKGIFQIEESTSVTVIHISDIWSGDYLLELNSTTTSYTVTLPPHSSKMVSFTKVTTTTTESQDKKSKIIWATTITIAVVLCIAFCIGGIVFIVKRVSPSLAVRKRG